MAIAGIAQAIVAASGGDYTTVDEAIDAGEVSIYVRAGFSGASGAQDVAGVEVEWGPGCTITDGATITGNNNSVIYGPGCDVQGEIDVTTGVEAFIEAMNGVSMVGIDLNTEKCYVNGGGWGTLSNGGTARDAIISSSADCIMENIALTTLGGGGSAFSAFKVGPGVRNIIRLVKSLDSDSTGCTISGVEILLLGLIFLDGDTTLIFPQAARSRVLAAALVSGANTGIFTASGADDGIYVGSVVQAIGNDEVTLVAGGDNNVVVGNRVIGVITDNAASSTVAANDTT